jgi:ApbE superfamily uncharacterized protein (UPF0280 family)
LEASPALDPRRGWQETILRTRQNLEDVISRSPALRGSLDAVLTAEHPRALRLLASVLQLYGQTPRVSLTGIHYSTDQVLGPWLP